MAGRFGKYGDFKRKARILRGRQLKRDVERQRLISRRLKKDKRIKLQRARNPQVSLETGPDGSWLKKSD